MGTYWRVGESLDTWLHEAQEMLFLNFDWEMMTYWTIVGVGTALRYLHEVRARELDAVQLETRLGRGATPHACSGRCSRTSCSTRSTRSSGADASRRRSARTR
jgi:hypothetical protein